MFIIARRQLKFCILACFKKHHVFLDKTATACFNLSIPRIIESITIAL